MVDGMSSQPARPDRVEDLELPVGDLLARGRPLPPHSEMVIEGLTDEEGAAFLGALEA
jgi:hypothetical protein